MGSIGPELLGRLFDAHAAALRLYARQWCAGSAAEDVVQEAFPSLARQSAVPDQVAAWLHRVVRDAAISAARSRHRRLKREARASSGETWFFDRDRMLFEAGRAEVQGTIQAGTSARLWKYATATAVLLASGLGIAWHNERSQRRALELTFARLAPPPAVVSTPEFIAERQEKEAAIDPTSYLALVRQVNRLEDATDLEPHRTAPGTVPSVRAADPPQIVPLRPRDWERVISL